ncbi:MAG: hypothetical protein HQL97_00445 [Magnetococcales bacterium]|nr:hypothetical protein [Magnetococcales bacterium]
MLALLLIAILALPAVAGATSYYVNATTGNDSSAGTSIGEAWQTIAKVNASSFSAGDTIYFARGETWREGLVAPSSGSSSGYVTFDAYGSGALPIISGADIKANSAFTADSGYAYSTSYTLIANGSMMVWEDGVRLTSRASQALVQANPGSFYLTGSTLYVSARDGSNIVTNGKVYEVPGRHRNVYTNGKDFIKIRNLHTIRTSGDDTTYGGIVVSGSDNIVEYVESHNHRRHAAQILSETGINGNRNIVQNSTLYDTWGTLVISVFQQNVATVTCADNIIRDNDIYGGTTDTNSGLLTIHGVDGAHQVLRTKIYGNRLHDSLSSNQAIQFYDVEQVRFYGNWVYGTFAGNPIYTKTRGSGVVISANFINMAGVVNTTDAMFLQDIAGTRVLHNIFYGQNGRWAVRFHTNATNGVVQNNIFHTVSKVINVDASAQSGFSMNWNDAYGVTAGATWGKWGATEYTFANWKSTSSQDANTVEVDPQLPSINTANWPASNLFVALTSPMYHAGKHAQGARDARGRRFYMGGRPTIGPYEYGAGDLAGSRVAR